MTTWNLKEYLDWIERGCNVNTPIVTLYMSYNQLNAITSEIVNLHNLQELYLSFNNSI